MDKIEDILQELGIKRSYKAYSRLIVALTLALEDEDRLRLITKLYQEVGEKAGCSWKAVEHSIRTAINRVWKKGRKRLQEIARYTLEKKPSVSDFMDILVTYLYRQDESEQNKSPDRK